MRGFLVVGWAAALGFSGCSAVPNRTGSKAPVGLRPAVRLMVQYLPQRIDGGKEIVVDGEPIVNYVPAGATVDRQERIEIRADLLVQTEPRTPDRYFGRIVPERRDIKVLGSDRILTDGQGEFHATIRTRTAKEWKIKIEPVPKDLPVEWEN